MLEGRGLDVVLYVIIICCVDIIVGDVENIFEMKF